MMQTMVKWKFSLDICKQNVRHKKDLKERNVTWTLTSFQTFKTRVKIHHSSGRNLLLSVHDNTDWILTTVRVDNCKSTDRCKPNLNTMGIRNFKTEMCCRLGKIFEPASRIHYHSPPSLSLVGISFLLMDNRCSAI